MSRIKWLFIGPDGLRHGWRFLIFVAAIVLVAQFLEQRAIAFLGAKLHIDRSALSASSIIVGDGFDLIVVLIVTGVFALCERPSHRQLRPPDQRSIWWIILEWRSRRSRGCYFCRSRDARHRRNAHPRDRITWN